jgi:hypothetical protein
LAGTPGLHAARASFDEGALRRFVRLCAVLAAWREGTPAAC